MIRSNLSVHWQGLVSMIAESTSAMLQIWERKAECSGGNVEITVDEDLRRLSADMISRASFGSSHDDGEKIFNKLQALQRLMSKGNIGVPGLRYMVRTCLLYYSYEQDP